MRNLEKQQTTSSLDLIFSTDKPEPSSGGVSQVNYIRQCDPIRLDSNTEESTESDTWFRLPLCEQPRGMRAYLDLCIPRESEALSLSETETYRLFWHIVLQRLPANAFGEAVVPLSQMLCGEPRQANSSRLGFPSARAQRWIVQCEVGPQDFSADQNVSALGVSAFLEDVYDIGQRDIQAATDKVFDTIDRLLCDGREDLCDEILASVEVARLPSALLRSFLTITAPAKDRLRSRSSFFAKAFDEVKRQRGLDLAKRLLGRLE